MINAIQICYDIGKKEGNFKVRNTSKYSHLGLSQSIFSSNILYLYILYLLLPRLVMSISNQFSDDRLNRVSKKQFFLRFSEIWFRLIDHTEIEKLILNSSQTFLCETQFWKTFIQSFFGNNPYFRQCWALNWM